MSESAFYNAKKIILRIYEGEGIKDRAHSIIRQIEKDQIIARAREHFRETGEWSNKDLRQQLSRKYHYSEKEVQWIIYNNKG